MINIIVFSKNRAAQLDLLIRSFKFYFLENDLFSVNVLYKSTTSDFENGYDKVKNKFQKINFIKENNFKNDLNNSSLFKFPYTMFLVDDNVFVNEISIKDKPFTLFKDDQRLLCISPRMNPRVETCYMHNKRKVKIPTLSNNLEWNWMNAARSDLYQGYPSDWGYPMSVDGNIFRTNDIIGHITHLNYNSPNTFEGVLSANPIHRPHMICYKDSKLFNNPINKVQTVCNNISATTFKNFSPEELNSKFLGGYFLDFIPYGKINILDPHQEEELFFIKD